VLLLDEPTNSLDPRTRKWFIKRLTEFNQNGTTVVIATHDLDLGAKFADRVLVMNEAHTIAALGKPEELMTNEELLTEVNLI
jgi:cobalt/nickel transport system ATP-binding protein